MGITRFACMACALCPGTTAHLTVEHTCESASLPIGWMFKDRDLVLPEAGLALRPRFVFCVCAPRRRNKAATISVARLVTLSIELFSQPLFASNHSLTKCK